MTDSPSQTGFAAVNGAQIHYEIAGQGQPLVFIHAGICDMRMWDDQMAFFAPHFLVARYDQRGYGKSHPVPGDYSLIDDLWVLLDRLEIERAALVGCSLGGIVALDFALLHPDRVDALVMVCSTPSGYPITDADRPSFWPDMLKAWDANDLERVSEYEVQIWVDGRSRTPDQVPSHIRDKVRAMNLIALQNEKAEIGDDATQKVEAINRLSEIDVPLLAISGDLDEPHVQHAMKQVASQVKNVRHVVMSGTGHVPNMEQPEAFNAHLLAFLRDTIDS